ncbi:MAG: DsbA family protein [Xanthomonadales bacterium]|nr:DsbA family protein [Xanthomonadales bacterium]
MCSWCWAYRPTMLQLRDNLPGEIRWQNVLGGLAPDNDQPMPENLQHMIQSHWRQIKSTVGTEFNFDFWKNCQPRRDTYKACRAVIAAAQQQAEEAMIEAIQKAYYLRAMNPSEPDTLADLAAELGLNRPRFVEDLGSAVTETEFQRQLTLRDRLNVRSFPSLVLQQNSLCSNIRHDYQDFRTSLAEINHRLNTTDL